MSAAAVTEKTAAGRNRSVYVGTGTANVQHCLLNRSAEFGKIVGRCRVIPLRQNKYLQTNRTGRKRRGDLPVLFRFMETYKNKENVIGKE